MRHVVIAAAMAATLPSAGALAAIFADDFEIPAGSVGWDLANPAKSQTVAVDDFEIVYGLDYSTVPHVSGVPIPAAPGSTGTRGLGFRVNTTSAGGAEGVAVHPILALPGDYVVNAWAFIAYETGLGSSEHAFIGANTDGARVPFAALPGSTGVNYGLPHDTGLSANTTDDYFRVANGTFTQLYGNGVAAPDPDTLDIPDVTQEGNPEIDDIYGTLGFLGGQWFEVELSDVNDIVTLKINGVAVDSYDNTGGTTSGDLLFGGVDIFAGSANPTIWHIWDNVTVNVIPEPGIMSLLSAGLLGLMRRRRP